jgi:hypothetical protein
MGIFETYDKFEVTRFVGEESSLLRPRVSSKISEYVVSFLIHNVGNPLKLHNNRFKYEIILFFSIYTPTHKHFSGSDCDTEDDKFVPIKYRTSQNVKKIGAVHVYSKKLDTMNNIEYANVVYDMISCLWLYNHKKVKIEHFLQHKEELDYDYIDGFAFPASVDEQDYSSDNLVNYQTQISEKERYLKHFDF